MMRGIAIVTLAALVACRRTPPPTAAAEPAPAPRPASTASDSSSSASSDASNAASTGVDAPAQRPTIMTFTDADEDPMTGKPRAPSPLDPKTAFNFGPGTVLTLHRTMCYGTCPHYMVGLTGDGTVHYYGVMYTQVLGYRAAKIDQAAALGLLDFLRAHDFLSLHTRYIRMATDNPSYVVVLHQGAAYKLVDHDASNETEPRLDVIEKEIDRVLGSARWIGPPQRGPHAGPEPPPVPSSTLALLMGTPLALAKAKCLPHGARTASLAVTLDDLGNARVQGNGGIVTPASECFAKELHPILPLVDMNDVPFSVSAD